jgi:hypothetical protein
MTANEYDFVQDAIRQMAASKKQAIEETPAEWRQILLEAKEQVEAQSKKQKENEVQSFSEWVESIIEKEVPEKELPFFACFLANAYFSLTFIRESFFSQVRMRKLSEKKTEFFINLCEDKIVKLLDPIKISTGLKLRSESYSSTFISIISNQTRNLRSLKALSNDKFQQATLPCRVECIGYDSVPRGARGWILPPNWCNSYDRGYVGVLFDEEFVGAGNCAGKLRNSPKKKHFYFVNTDYLKAIQIPEFSEEVV